MSDVETNANGGRQSRLAERTDLLPPAAVLAVARVLKGGAAKYGDRNWRLIGVREHLNHALTHAYKYLAGDAEEPHLHNAACRLMMALEIELVGMDRPDGFPRPVAAAPTGGDLRAAHDRARDEFFMAAACGHDKRNGVADGPADCLECDKYRGMWATWQNLIQAGYGYAK
jgi:hypothetical protein